MDQPQLPGHPAKGISLLSVSLLLERLSYYGFRSIIVLYFVSELRFQNSQAADWYGTFTLGIYLTVFIGALLGDFLIGAPAAIIVGGVLEALGCFCVAIPGEYPAIAGLVFIALGTGLFRPNMLSQVSAIYKSRVRYTDAGFSIIYFVINVGAFLGPMIIALIGEKVNYSIGFCMAGAVALVSILPVALDYKNQQNSFVLRKQYKAPGDPVSIISLVGILFLLPVFWAIFETLGSFAYSANQGDYFSEIVMPQIILMVVLAVSIVLWSFVKLDSLYKIGLGFLLLLVTFALVSFFPAFEKHATLLSVLPELLVAIPAYAVISRFAPPKLNGLFFALSISLAYVGYNLSSFFGSMMETNHDVAVYSIIGICVFAAALFFILATNLVRQKERNLLG